MLQRIRRLSLLATACALLGSAAAAAAAEPASITVFAAASLTNTLQEVGAAYTRATGQTVKFSFAGTATLARQIEQGAPADVFISADKDWMDYVAQRNLIDPSTRRDLLGGRLVLIAPAGSSLALPIAPGFPIAAALGPNGRLSLADPASVPAGRYAKAALTSLGVWDSVATRVAASENVRTAMTFVARGEAPLGIVYETDARLEAGVKVLGVFPEDSHPPIRYAVARLRSAPPTAFLEFLGSPLARGIFERAGFTVLPANTSAAVASAAPSKTERCETDDWDLSREMSLFRGTAVAVTAARTTAKLPALDTAGLNDVLLTRQPQVQFLQTPGKQKQTDAAYAGLLQFTVRRNGRYRITIDGPFWIDVLAGGKALRSTAFKRTADCSLFHKSVEFELAAGQSYELQLSGATQQRVRVAILPTRTPDSSSRSRR